jgi:hypothetical protein
LFAADDRSELAAKVLRKEPGFTRFRVMTVSCTRYFDIRKAKRILGYEPIVGISEGVLRACKVRNTFPKQSTMLIVKAYQDAGLYSASAPSRK